MNIQPIRTDDDLQRAFGRIDELWGATPGTAEGDELDVLVVLVEDYERRHHSLPAGDPVEIISYKLSELGWSGRELARRLGWSSGRVSEILSRKRGLTLAMVQQLATVLSIDPGILVGREQGDASGDGWVWINPGLVEIVRTYSTDGTTPATWIERAIRRSLPSFGAISAITVTSEFSDFVGVDLKWSDVGDPELLTTTREDEPRKAA